MIADSADPGRDDDEDDGTGIDTDGCGIVSDGCEIVPECCGLILGGGTDMVSSLNSVRFCLSRRGPKVKVIPYFAKSREDERSIENRTRKDNEAEFVS